MALAEEGRPVEYLRAILHRAEPPLRDVVDIAKHGIAYPLALKLVLAHVPAKKGIGAAGACNLA
jgi:hypothetical protein